MLGTTILQDRLEGLNRKTNLRNLQRPVGIDFSSNDYLGFAKDAELNRRFLKNLEIVKENSSGASRLLRGNLELHEKTEAILAQFVGRTQALLFPSGYQANLGLFSSLKPEDLVFSDELNHSSIIDGIKLSGAKKIIYPHNDLDHLEKCLREAVDHGLKIIITESVFSMDGDQANLIDLANLAQKYSALLIVDEAHATGVFGRGLVHSLDLQDKVFATVHTGGKALGAGGGWIACDDSLRNYLINFSRPFIFSTGCLPSLCILLQSSIEYYTWVGEQRSCTVLAASKLFQDEMNLTQSRVLGPIIPIILGENDVTLRVARKLQEKGFDVRGIRPPSVPLGKSRLRLTINYPNTNETVLSKLAHELKNTIKEEI